MKKLPIPARRAQFFARFGTRPSLIKEVLKGGEEKSNDDKLVELGIMAGNLAVSFLNTSTADFWQHRILGYCVGWLMALGEKEPWTRIHQNREFYEQDINAGAVCLNWYSTTLPNERKFRALMVRIGAVADAIDRMDSMKNDAATCRHRLNNQLVALAACCCAWLETFEPSTQG